MKKSQLVVRCLKCNNSETVLNTPKFIKKYYTCYYCGSGLLKLFKFNKETAIFDKEV